MLSIGVFALWLSEHLMGVGSSGPTRGRSRVRDAGESVETSVVLHARLKRLRCENAVLKHECKVRRALASFARDQVDELRIHQRGESLFLHFREMPSSGT